MRQATADWFDRRLAAALLSLARGKVTLRNLIDGLAADNRAFAKRSDRQVGGYFSLPRRLPRPNLYNED